MEMTYKARASACASLSFQSYRDRQKRSSAFCNASLRKKLWLQILKFWGNFLSIFEVISIWHRWIHLLNIPTANPDDWLICRSMDYFRLFLHPYLGDWCLYLHAEKIEQHNIVCIVISNTIYENDAYNAILFLLFVVHTCKGKEIGTH